MNIIAAECVIVVDHLQQVRVILTVADVLLSTDAVMQIMMLFNSIRPQGWYRR